MKKSLIILSLTLFSLFFLFAFTPRGVEVGDDSVIRVQGEVYFDDYVYFSQSQNISFSSALYFDSSVPGNWMFNVVDYTITDSNHGLIYSVSQGGWVGKMSSKYLYFPNEVTSSQLVEFCFDNERLGAFTEPGRCYFEYTGFNFVWGPGYYQYMNPNGELHINGKIVCEGEVYDRFVINGVSKTITLTKDFTDSTQWFKIYDWTNGGWLFDGNISFAEMKTTRFIYTSLVTSGFVGLPTSFLSGTYRFNDTITFTDSSHDSMRYSNEFNYGTYNFKSGNLVAYSFSYIYTYDSSSVGGEYIDTVYTPAGWKSDVYRIVDFGEGWYVPTTFYNFITSNAVVYEGPTEYEQGYEQGYQEGYEQGKEDGYALGVQNGSSFATFFTDLFTAPAKMLDSLVIFEVPELGIRTTLWTILTTCMIICVLGWILRLIAGG